MSILQEYKEIRNAIGEKEFQTIETFLAMNPEYLLSDVFYNKEVYEIYVNWKESQ